jgi:hypothetical protein
MSQSRVAELCCRRLHPIRDSRCLLMLPQAYVLIAVRGVNWRRCYRPGLETATASPPAPRADELPARASRVETEGEPGWRRGGRGRSRRDRRRPQDAVPPLGGLRHDAAERRVYGRLGMVARRERPRGSPPVEGGCRRGIRPRQVAAKRGEAVIVITVSVNEGGVLVCVQRCAKLCKEGLRIFEFVWGLVTIGCH